MDIIEQLIKVAGKNSEEKSSKDKKPFPFNLKLETGKKSKSKKDKPSNEKSSIKKAMQRWDRRKYDTDPVLLRAVAEDVLDEFLGNEKAASKMDDEACVLLSVYSAFLRALYLIHHQNHLETAGYENHLLFQRLYESVQGMADDACEKTVGLCGELVHQELVGTIAKSYILQTKNSPVLFLKCSLAAEQAFQDIAKYVYVALKEKGCLTLGADDMIMSQANESEGHIYLLQQAINQPRLVP